MSINSVVCWKTYDRTINKKESARQLKIFQARLDDVTANIQLLRERQASFADKVMSDRYTLIQDIENKLESVYVNYDRWRRDPKLYQLDRIDGETVLITEINSALRVNKESIQDFIQDHIWKYIQEYTGVYYSMNEKF